MLEKGMQQSWKNNKNWAKKGNGIDQKTYKKGGPKIDAKKHVYFDRAFGTLIGYLQGTPPVQNPHIKDTTHKVL